MNDKFELAGSGEDLFLEINEDVKPFGKWILVEENVDEKYRSIGDGIVVAPNATLPYKRRYTQYQGIVLDIGNDVNIDIKKGDKVLWGFYAGYRIGNNRWLIRENKVLGILEEFCKLWS